mmetsp:Transcript_3433/g.7817  ORF Transcript_3433/g.7817 Transcript_3433/m.7817 type:complete len:202 (+) Transcript_3433:382-987(+)
MLGLTIGKCLRLAIGCLSSDSNNSRSLLRVEAQGGLVVHHANKELILSLPIAILARIWKFLRVRIILHCIQFLPTRLLPKPWPDCKIEVFDWLLMESIAIPSAFGSNSMTNLPVLPGKRNFRDESPINPEMLALCSCVGRYIELLFAMFSILMWARKRMPFKNCPNLFLRHAVFHCSHKMVVWICKPIANWNGMLWLAALV